MDDPVPDSPPEPDLRTATTSRIPQSYDTAWWNLSTNYLSGKFRMCLVLSPVIQSGDHRRVQGVL
jgi:hypothetical protein